MSFIQIFRDLFYFTKCILCKKNALATFMFVFSVVLDVIPFIQTYVTVL